MQPTQQLPTLFVDDLAALLGKTRDSIYTTLSRAPESLPPPLTIPGRSALIWLREDVVEWLKQHRATTSARPPSRRGAPTKRERARAAAAGMTVKEFREGVKKEVGC